jgi:NADH:ubiquinone oxidoreductase subunit 4 (subunit M)
MTWNTLFIIIIIIIIILLQLGWHPVAVVHIYTQTVHRIQRTEHT